MGRAGPRENFHLGFDSSHLRQLSANRFFCANGKQPQSQRKTLDNHYCHLRTRDVMIECVIFRAGNIIINYANCAESQPIRYGKLFQFFTMRRKSRAISGEKLAARHQQKWPIVQIQLISTAGVTCVEQSRKTVHQIISMKK